MKCGAFERKENDFWQLTKMIYTHDTAIKNSQVHHCSLNIKIYKIYIQKHSSDLIYAWRKLNLNCKYLALLY